MKRLLCAAALVTTMLAGGCGIPDESDVTVVGNGPSGVGSVGDVVDPPVQYTRESTNDPKTFADYYLQAAAGDPETAAARVKDFLSPDEAAKFPASTDIKVVREVEDKLYTASKPEDVTLFLEVIGTLGSNGVLQPEPASDPIPYKLRIGPVSGKNGLFVLDAPPPMMLMTDRALASFYQPHTIYFWNSANTRLVPDPRYLPRSVPRVQQPTVILGWLTGPPAQWLGDAVNSLPQGTQATENVPAISNDTLTISLNDKALPQGADGGALDRLRRQLQWSMRELLPRTIEIKIGRGEPVRSTSDDYLDSNPAYRLADAPERFVIYGNTIRRLKDTPHADDPIPVIKPAANKNIVSAAVSASLTRAYAAVVTGTGTSRRLRVAQALLGQQAELKEVDGVSGSLGVPVWAQVPAGDDVTKAVGLITMNGRIYSFGAAGSRAQHVDLQGLPGVVTAISVAPDGHRVALVSGGKLYRTVISTDGDGIALGAPEQVLPPTLKSVAAVAWSSETYLVVAGMRPNNRYAVLDLTSDGALSTTRLDDIGTAAVTYLTAYPSNPATGKEASDLKSYVAGNNAWDVFSDPYKIKADQLAGPPVNPQNTATPTSPFFLD